METRERVIVAAVLVSKDNKVFLGRIREGGVYPNCWHSPGGGVDEGETKEAALVREIKEEVGINISNYPVKLLDDTDTGECIKTDKHTGIIFLAKMQFNNYQVNLPQNAKDVKVSLNSDIRNYKWVAVEDLKNYQLTPPSQKVFKKLGWV